MATTIGGVPWLQARPFDDTGPTYEEWNRDCLAPLSRRHGYCLCYHPFSDVINFDGLGCNFCDQTTDERSHGPEARQLRTQATLAAYPQLRKDGS